jgi:hypothetical protein
LTTAIVISRVFANVSWPFNKLSYSTSHTMKPTPPVTHGLT